MPTNKFTPDKAIIAIGIVYILLPICIFATWLRFYIACPFILLLVCFGFFFYKAVTDGDNSNLFNKYNRGFWITTSIIIIAWVYLSGIGSFVYQNSDYWVRNPIFRDLSNCKWPIIYDLACESEKVREICGSDKVAFSYYFCWWLPVAAAAKVFKMTETASNIFLFIWAIIGVLEVFYLLCRKFNNCSWIIIFVMIFFSGLDIVPWFLLNNKFEVGTHIEWWAGYFQYSSNTTQLFWVFNQAIPIWLIVAFVLQLKDSKYIAALCSLAFAYSPWATFGMVPIAICASFKNKKIKKCINVLNILVPLSMLLIFGSFFLASSGSGGKIGTIFEKSSDNNCRIFMNYLVFIFFEFIVYFLLMGKSWKKYEFHIVVLIELILFPLFIVRDYNFEMRGSMPALFFLMYYVIRYLLEQYETQRKKLKYKLMVIGLFIGLCTPLSEICRTVKSTMTSNSLLQEQIGSFSNILTEDEAMIVTIKEQFFVYDYNNTLFFKYFAR